MRTLLDNVLACRELEHLVRVWVWVWVRAKLEERVCLYDVPRPELRADLHCRCELAELLCRDTGEHWHRGEPPLQADQWKIYPTQVYKKRPYGQKSSYSPYVTPAATPSPRISQRTLFFHASNISPINPHSTLDIPHMCYVAPPVPPHVSLRIRVFLGRRMGRGMGRVT